MLFIYVQAKPPHVSSPRRLGSRQIHFLTSYVWRFWDHSRHFFELLMCAAPIYWDLRQFGICRHLFRGCGSPGDLQYPGYYQRVDRDTIHFTYPSLSKGLLAVGSMVCFSNSQRLLRQARTPHRSINPVTAFYGYLLNPQQTDPANQDALGLITIYPRPDEHSNPPQLPASASRSHSIQPPSNRSRRAAAPKIIFHPSLILP